MEKKTEGKPPRVFISYSHSPAEHAERVLAIGQRLANDGIDVEIDKWSVREGHDLNAFMERMVTDATVSKVLIFSNKSYAEKPHQRNNWYRPVKQASLLRHHIRAVPRIIGRVFDECLTAFQIQVAEEIARLLPKTFLEGNRRLCEFTLPIQPQAFLITCKPARHGFGLCRAVAEDGEHICRLGFTFWLDRSNGAQEIMASDQAGHAITQKQIDMIFLGKTFEA